MEEQDPVSQREELAEEDTQPGKSIFDNGGVKTWLEQSGRLYLKRVGELSLIRRLTDSISLDLDIERACQYTLTILLDELNIANASIMFFDDERGGFVHRTAKGRGDQEASFYDDDHAFGGVCLREGEGIAGLVFRERQPLLITDTELDERFRKDEKQTVQIGSLACLPLIVRGKGVGVLNLSHPDKGAINQEDIHGLTIVANQIAMLLDNASNYRKLQEINVDLEAKVRERTQHLEEANRELQEARSRLVRSETLRALGQMASGVAHDFNNILATITGNTQLLLAEVDDSQIRPRLKAIEMAAMDGAATIRRIQEFSRVKKSREVGPVDLNQVIRDVVMITSPLWKDERQRNGNAVEVLTRLGNVQGVTGNAAELREILTNMILNCLDALPKGGTIALSTWADEGSVCLAVADNGVGMAPEVRERVFEPFFTTKGPGNSGLGLSVAYGIVRRHEGEIAVESLPGEGTTFLIRLPRGATAAPAPDPAPQASLVARARVLVIDDEPAVRDVLAAMLEKAGHDVVSASRGREGIDVFHTATFDVVFTDLGMPDMSGFEVAASVKQHSPTTAVVMITGWGKDLEIEKIRKEGVDLLISKPFDLIKVQNSVAEALRLRKTCQ
jgi:signal transduction histidine kinase/CheY-like chemotaxis protein